MPINWNLRFDQIWENEHYLGVFNFDLQIEIHLK